MGIRKNKKSLIYLPLLAVVTLVTMLSIYIVIGSKGVQFEKSPIGKKQFDFVSSVARGENSGLYIDESAKRASYQAWFELAQDGGYAESSPCGEFENYQLWTSNRQECYPLSIKAAFASKFNRVFSPYIDKFSYNYIPSGNFIVNIEKSGVSSIITGHAIKPLYLNQGDEPFAPLSVMPSAAKQKKALDRTLENQNIISDVAKRQGVDMELLVGILAGTSGGDPNFVSGYGCVGIAGICYPAAEGYKGQRKLSDCDGYGMNCMESSCEIIKDDFRRNPEQSLEFIAEFIKEMKKKFSDYTTDEEFLERLSVASLFIDPTEFVVIMQAVPATDRTFEHTISKIELLRMDKSHIATDDSLDRCGEKFKAIRETIYRIFGYKKAYLDRLYYGANEGALDFGKDPGKTAATEQHEGVRPADQSFYSMNPSFKVSFPYSEDDYKSLRETARKFQSAVVDCSKKSTIPECAAKVFSDQKLEKSGWKMDEYTPDEQFFFWAIEEIKQCLFAPEKECSCKIRLDTSIAGQDLVIQKNEEGEIEFSYSKESLNLADSTEGKNVKLMYHHKGKDVPLSSSLTYHIDPELLSAIDYNDVELSADDNDIDNSNEGKDKGAMYLAKMNVAKDVYLGFFSKKDYEDYLVGQKKLEPCTRTESKESELTFKFTVEDSFRGQQWIYNEEQGKLLKQNIIHRFAISFYDQEAPPQVEEISAEDLLDSEQSVLLKIKQFKDASGKMIDDLSHYNIYCAEKTSLFSPFGTMDLTGMTPVKEVRGFDHDADEIYVAVRWCDGNRIADSQGSSQHEYVFAVTAVDFSGNENSKIKATATGKSIDDLAPSVLFPYTAAGGSIVPLKYRSEQTGNDLDKKYILYTDIKISNKYARVQDSYIYYIVSENPSTSGGFLSQTLPFTNADAKTTSTDVAATEVLFRPSTGQISLDKSQYSSVLFNINWDAVSMMADAPIYLSEEQGLPQDGAIEYDVIVLGVDEAGNVIQNLGQPFVDHYADDSEPKITIVDRLEDSK